MNQSIWANLEGKVRSWSSGADTLFIVTGAAVTTLTDKNIEWKTNKNDGKQVAVPKFYYKALARKVNGVFQTIGFKLEQKSILMLMVIWTVQFLSVNWRKKQDLHSSRL
ncbi:hypothetical protein BFINE_04460 [Bacteroides finegoldii DSM 17565]|nr:hypothetical protein BFINE_04460 [Bacteroides finegoldii DSM 17565]